MSGQVQTTQSAIPSNFRRCLVACWGSPMQATLLPWSKWRARDNERRPEIKERPND